MSKLIVFLFAAVIMLTGCVKWKDGSPGTVWMGGLWLVFWIPFLAAVFFWYKTWNGRNSPEVFDRPSTGERNIPTGNPKTPWFKVQYIWYAIALTAATIAIYIGVSLSA